MVLNSALSLAMSLGPDRRPKPHSFVPLSLSLSVSAMLSKLKPSIVHIQHSEKYPERPLRARAHSGKKGTASVSISTYYLQDSSSAAS